MGNWAISIDLGEDHLGCPLSHAGDGVQQLNLRLERAEGLLDPLRDRLDVGLTGLDAGNHLVKHEAVVIPEASGECLAQLGDLPSHPALRQIGQSRRVFLAGDQRPHHLAPGDPQVLDGRMAPTEDGSLLERSVYVLGQVDRLLAVNPGTARRSIDGYSRAGPWLIMSLR